MWGVKGSPRGGPTVQQTKVSAEPQLERIVLAQEAEFTLGGLRISPSKREVSGGGAPERLQPRIMQVLVVLARRRGEVVSHDELIATCWGGCAVSDDAIHRCIARIRRLAEAHGGFRLETVPRVGYQLTEESGLPVPSDFWKRRTRLEVLVTLLLAGVLVFAAGLFGSHLL
jgi:DNA-binding winged helix-turn-helix (wHTH) protein